MQPGSASGYLQTESLSRGKDGGEANGLVCDRREPESARKVAPQGIDDRTNTDHLRLAQQQSGIRRRAIETGDLAVSNGMLDSVDDPRIVQEPRLENCELRKRVEALEAQLERAVQDEEDERAILVAKLREQRDLIEDTLDRASPFERRRLRADGGFDLFEELDKQLRALDK